MNRKYIYPIVLLIIASVLIWYFQKNDRGHFIKDSEVQLANAPAFSYLPTSTTGAIVSHDYYTLSYSEPDEQAEWVAYELTKEQLSTNSFERPYFEIDPKVTTGAAHWNNYRNSGYDRGHLCPAADRKFTKQAYLETFLTSNISPQDHAFNSGIWNQLEQQVRLWAAAYHKIYIVTGGILSNKIGAIGEEDVTVPGQFYKIILYQDEDEVHMIGFLLPHEASRKELSSFAVPVDSIEQLTGIDFFPELEDTLENRLEASVVLEYWDF